MANPQEKKSSRAQLLCTVHESARPNELQPSEEARVAMEEAMVGVEAMAAVRMAVLPGAAGRAAADCTMVDIGRGGGGRCSRRYTSK